MKIEGRIIDVFERRIYSAEISIKDGFIEGIEEVYKSYSNFILPGLIDSHVHIESSMCTPGAFAGAAVSRGTVAVVSDPHEIANVLGMDGIQFMIGDSEKVPVKFFFGAPSCVPATTFETNGAAINHKMIDTLLRSEKIKYLAEMMNFPGVINEDQEVIKKLETAKKYRKPIDGHAPGLTGEMLKKYVSSGISTDHECTTIDEAREKIGLGMKILIREGSAARNLDELKSLMLSDPEMVMLCSDDLHPEMLLEGHINKLVARLISEGYDLFDVIRSCTLNPALHYNLNTGILKPGYPADFIIVDDYTRMNVLQTWINGKPVFDKGNLLFNYSGALKINKFNCSEIRTGDIEMQTMNKKIRLIEAFDGSLFTRGRIVEMGEDFPGKSDSSSDILKIVVKDRYSDSPPAVGFIKGFGLQKGALAGSVSHDSHNIISLGTNDTDITSAINEIVRLKGGLALAVNDNINSMQLEIAGIMTDKPVQKVAEEYNILSDMAKTLGCSFLAPFMTLSFMALPVIPELKMTDKGLFDVSKFSHVPLFA